MSQHQCQSCAMPIETGVYCQYCSDEKGNLQPFEERFDRMVQWMSRQIWRSLTAYVYPFQWIALLPLMEVALRQGELERAVACIDPILDPDQHYLAGSATDALVRAKRCWLEGNTSGARSLFDMAMKHLAETDYR